MRFRFRQFSLYNGRIYNMYKNAYILLKLKFILIIFYLYIYIIINKNVIEYFVIFRLFVTLKKYVLGIFV